MATEAEMKKIAVKMIEEDDFRTAFEADPEKAAASLGITFAAEQLEEIKKSKAAAEVAGPREAKGVVSIVVSVLF